MEERKKRRPGIGLALGGGGARGYAHLGVLKALEESNIPIDVIAGTSMGAVVGAAYATGYRIDELIDMALRMRWRQLVGLVDLTIPRQGLIAGSRLEKYFSALTMGREFNQLEKTLIVVAADIATGEEVHINSGSVARALRASTAVPGIFWPVKSGRRLLVDGTVTSPVPVEAAVEAGADVVVAVDVSSPVGRSDVLVQAWKWWKGVASGQTHHMLGVSSFWRFLKPVLPEGVNIVDRSLDLYRLYVNMSPRVTPSIRCWLLKPAVEEVGWYEFHRARECIQAGEAVGRGVAEQVRGFLQATDRTKGIAHEIGWGRKIMGGNNEGW